jgi:hypothetical protein
MVCSCRWNCSRSHADLANIIRSLGRRGPAAPKGSQERENCTGKASKDCHLAIQIYFISIKSARFYTSNLFRSTNRRQSKSETSANRLKERDPRREQIPRVVDSSNLNVSARWSAKKVFHGAFLVRLGSWEEKRTTTHP